MALQKKDICTDELVDSGLGSSFPEDIRDGVENLKINDESLTNSQHNGDNADQGTYGYTLKKDKEGDSSLHLSIAIGNEDLALKLISLLSQESVNAQNDIGQTPLHIAVIINMPSVIRRLIDIGADLGICDSFGNNIVHLAAEYGNDRAVIEIFTHSIHRDMRELSKICHCLLESRNFQGFTPFHVAIKEKKFETALLLRHVGADVNAMDGKAGYSSLHHLVERGNLAHIQLFIEKFKPVIDAQSFSGLTPLHLTMEEGSADVAAILILNGADPEKECMDGLSWYSVMYPCQ